LCQLRYFAELVRDIEMKLDQGHADLLRVSVEDELG
jgi:hypothetical protein